VVRRDGERVIVSRRKRHTRREELLASLPVQEVEQVVVYGYPQLTMQVVTLLLRHGVDIVLLTPSGGYIGGIQRQGSHFARLRRAQFQMAADPTRALRIALGVVQAKQANQRNLLRALAAHQPPATATQLERGAQGIERMRRSAAHAATLDALRGFEGKAAALYFAAIRLLIGPEWSFNGRQFYPPPDPFNALLSFGYALLQKDIESVAQRVGLDPYIGCLHALEDGRPSLTLDLMEEFRPLVVDVAMLQLVQEGRLRPLAFTFTGRTERPVEIGPDLLPQVIEAYEVRVAEGIEHSGGGGVTSLRRCFELQARIYAQTVRQERPTYEGMVA
jgi:CRISPR-associated protein Cas1